MNSGGAELVTFGDGSLRWRRAAERLGREAEGSGLFERISVWNARNLQEVKHDFFLQRRGLFDQQGPGFGYWSWKPFLLNWHLQHADPSIGQILYLDCGSHLNVNDASRKRFKEYEEYVTQNHVLLMVNEGLPELQWTKPSLRNRFNLTHDDWNSDQIMAGLIMVDRSSTAVEFCSEWEKACLESSGELLIDPKSSEDAGQHLRAHRHDQSVLSCLAKSRGYPKLGDEVYFAPDWNSAGSDYPIWTVRNRSGVRFSKWSPLFKVKKILERGWLRICHPILGGTHPDFPG